MLERTILQRAWLCFLLDLLAVVPRCAWSQRLATFAEAMHGVSVTYLMTL